MYLCFNVSIYNFTWCITLNDVRGFENERCCHIAEREREFFSRRSKLKNFFFSSMYNIIVLQNNNWKIYIFSLLLRERKKSSYLILFKLDLKCSRWNRFQVDAVGNPGHKTSSREVFKNTFRLLPPSDWQTRSCRFFDGSVFFFALWKHLFSDFGTCFRWWQFVCVCVIANRTAAVEMPLVAWFGLGVNKVEAIWIVIFFK